MFGDMAYSHYLYYGNSVRPRHIIHKTSLNIIKVFWPQEEVARPNKCERILVDHARRIPDQAAFGQWYLFRHCLGIFGILHLTIKDQEQSWLEEIVQDIFLSRVSIY